MLIFLSRRFPRLCARTASLQYYSTSGPSNGTRKHESRREKRRHDSHTLASESAVQLPRSLDISEEEARVDVEKFFPDAVRHLRSVPIVKDAALDRQQREFSKEVNHRSVDGIPLFSKEEVMATEPSFFEQGSLNIRSNSRERTQRDGQTVPTRTDEEAPDILGITGGNAFEHGSGLSEASNAAPADATIEQEEDLQNETPYKDTPVELTDMLKERLMELKTVKLREDQYRGYLPKRLNLASDEEVERASLDKKKPFQKRQLSQLGTSRTSTTLLDLDSDKPITHEKDTLEGISHEARASAAEYIRGSSESHVPGFASMAQAQTRYKGTQNNEEIPEGAVYLLRTLPRAGFCSRREAQGIITSGEVRVNNVVERNPFRLVQAEDDIHVSGHHSRLRFAPPRLWMYHKPSHVIVSRNDIAGRALMTKHAAILGIDHLIPVGSLPVKAHGVLLLTNDGELSRFLEDPQSLIQQTYLLRVRPAIDPMLAHKFNTKGITINGRRITGVEFLVNPSMKSRFSVKVKVRGEFLPIYELMRHIGRTIERGGRLAVGPFSLHNLAVGSVREVTVPPHYVEHTGKVWKTFVERDWPFFRRRRVARLRQLSRYRELTPTELEELESSTYNEIQESLSLKSTELSGLAGEELGVPERPSVDIPLPQGFGSSPMFQSVEEFSKEDIISDITAM